MKKKLLVCLIQQIFYHGILKLHLKEASRKKREKAQGSCCLHLQVTKGQEFMRGMKWKRGDHDTEISQEKSFQET